MKAVIYTQRVEIVESYGERRDCADQEIPRFINACGYLPVPVPNMAEIAEAFVKRVKPVGMVLTGGNSLAKYGGNAVEKDRMDAALIKIAIENNIPILGFCRGMQSILDYFSQSLATITGHVAINHDIIWNGEKRTVNSYHNQGIKQVSPLFSVLARAEDNVIEAIEHRKCNIKGIMWHPERQKPFDDLDMMMLKSFFL